MSQYRICSIERYVTDYIERRFFKLHYQTAYKIKIAGIQKALSTGYLWSYLILAIYLTKYRCRGNISI